MALCYNPLEDFMEMDFSASALGVFDILPVEDEDSQRFVWPLLLLALKRNTSLLVLRDSPSQGSDGRLQI